MNELQSLDRVKEAEAKAAQTIERANQTKTKIIEDAKDEASKIVERALGKAKQFREEKLKVVKEQLVSEKSSKVRSNEERIRNLKKITSSEKFNKEVERLVEKFLEMI